MYAIQDANYNLTSICNTSGTVQERYYYDPYGMQFIMDGLWSSISSSAYAWVVGHQGLMIDGESSLVYNRRRYVHFLAGCFPSRDPGYIDSANLCLYQLANPVTNLDPLGLWTFQQCWDQWLKPLGQNVKQSLVEWAADCAKQGIAPPPLGNAKAWAKCMLGEAKGTGKDALAQFACCMDGLPREGPNPDPYDREKTKLNCQHQCDWKKCVADYTNPKEVLGNTEVEKYCLADCDATCPA